MSKLLTKILFLFILFISVSFQASMTQNHVPHLKSPEEKTQIQNNQTKQVIQSLNELPLYFIENKGQIDERVRYLIKLTGMNVYFTSEEIVYQMFHREKGEVRVENIRVKFLGMNEEVKIESVEENGGKVNYFVGNDPERWVQGARTYEKVIYRELYPDIDLIVYGRGGRIKHEYRVRAEGEVEDIQIKYEGVKGLSVNEEGELELIFEGGELREGVPISYQVIYGEKVRVDCGYRVMRDNVIKFRLAEYKKDKELIIDPELSYSTFLGGSSEDCGYGIAIDGSGNAYVTGFTRSTDFPATSVVYDTSHNGSYDAFITKLNSTGTALSYSTFLGGSSEDCGLGIAIDGNGNAYVTGETSSTDFPTTSGAYDGSYNGGYRDAFITKLNATGSILLYSTYLGGSYEDHGTAIAIDGSRNAYITGETWSTNFPTTSVVYDTSHNGSYDAFITKLNSTGTALSYSTFLGGFSGDSSYGITIDGSGNAYVTGGTYSTDFPTTSVVYDTSHNGSNDAFITKLNSTGTALSYSTFLGGSSEDCGYCIAIDGSGNAYVTGETDSTDFPTTSVVYDTTHNGGWDSFIAKLDSTGTALSYSTFLGGSGFDLGNGIAIDGSRNAYVTGFTRSTDFPTTSGAYDTSHNGSDDAFITKLNSTGTALSYSTFLGGFSADSSFGIAIDGSGNAYVTGETWSTDFPTTSGAYDTSHNGGFYDAFVTKLLFGIKDDLLGTWSTGVWYRNSDTGSWVKMTTPTNLVAAGDIDGDSTDDLIGVWSSGLWVKYSSSGSWAKLSTTLPSDIASGDMNGDGRDDILGTWSTGVWYRNSNTGSWVKMTTPAQMVAAGDLDGDGTDDLIGVWSSGLWVKYSSTNSWLLITPNPPNSIASSDMNGDGRDDVLGTWPSGVWYRNSIAGGWVKMSTPAFLVAAGDIDGDGTDDLIGTWSSGLWVKKSSTASWQFICTSLPGDIDAGLFRTGWGAGAMSFNAPIVGVYAEGPGNIDDYEDLTSEAPGGWEFVYKEAENLIPQEKRLKIMRVPGPGEPGFWGIEQKNLVPRESLDKTRKKK